MSKKIFAILLICSFFFRLQAQEKRALLVGISKYDTALTGYQWNNINGANDVKLLAPILKAKGFKVTTLTDEKATHKNIIEGINKLIATSQKGTSSIFISPVMDNLLRTSVETKLMDGTKLSFL